MLFSAKWPKKGRFILHLLHRSSPCFLSTTASGCDSKKIEIAVCVFSYKIAKKGQKPYTDPTHSTCMVDWFCVCEQLLWEKKGNSRTEKRGVERWANWKLIDVGCLLHGPPPFPKDHTIVPGDQKSEPIWWVSMCYTSMLRIYMVNMLLLAIWYNYNVFSRELQVIYVNIFVLM